MEIKSLAQKFFLYFLLFIIYAVPRANFNFPFTLIEAKESYSAYALTSAQFWFPTDNNFISPIGVYLRAPFAKAGINYLSVRIPTFTLGFVVLLLFFLVAQSFFKNKIYAFIASVIFSLSPVFVYSSIFEINVMAVLLGVLVALLVLQKRNFPKKLLAILGICIILILPIRDFLFRQSVFYPALPTQTSYIIDHKLSTGMKLDSPLVTDEFNFTRFAYNKAFFAIEMILKNAISRFDFEMLFSPQEANTILQTQYEGKHHLPSLYLWELPFILIGLFTFLSKLPRTTKLLFAILIVGWLVFDASWLTMLLPFLVLAELSALQIFWKGKRIVVIFISILYLSAVAVFLRKFVDYKSWMNPVDIAQYEIWKTVTPQMTEEYPVTVTDRIGESTYYYLAYHQVDPKYFQQRIKRPKLENGIVRTEQIDNVRFSSFEFEQKKASKSIWIGKEEEFKDKVAHQEIFGGLWLVCNQCQ